MKYSPFFYKGNHMALWDMRKTEKITPLFDDNDLKEDVARLEK